MPLWNITIFILFISEDRVNVLFLNHKDKRNVLRENKHMEMKTMIDNLADAGCTKHDAEIAGELFKNGQTDELIQFLKKCRCSLMDEMHESQRKVDCMDFLIRRAERNEAK